MGLLFDCPQPMDAWLTQLKHHRAIAVIRVSDGDIKVFPVQALGGVSYIRSLQGPLQEIPLIPTGGVSLENAADFLAAGAVAVGLSSELFPLPLIGDRNWGAIAERVQTLVRRLSIPFG